MRILIIIPPILKDQNDPQTMLTVPPTGYGGVENVVYALLNGMVELGHKVLVIGAPGSRSMPNVEIIREPRNAKEIALWISENKDKFDIIHDNSCGLIFSDNNSYIIDNTPYVATHHQTGKSPFVKNTIYLSNAQRNQAGDIEAPVIRLPVITSDYICKNDKQDYYLYVGRVSEWKGVYEAAMLVSDLNSKLLIAGPNWEEDYHNKIINDFGHCVEFAGEVTGLKRIEYISNAKAVFVLSRFTKGPWGDFWCEPGSTIVSEAIASGTPVISSTNGCLDELVNDEVGIKLTEEDILNRKIEKIKKIEILYGDVLSDYAKKEWDYIKITKEYINIFNKIIKYEKSKNMWFNLSFKRRYK